MSAPQVEDRTEHITEDGKDICERPLYEVQCRSCARKLGSHLRSDIHHIATEHERQYHRHTEWRGLA